MLWIPTILFLWTLLNRLMADHQNSERLWCHTCDHLCVRGVSSFYRKVVDLVWPVDNVASSLNYWSEILFCARLSCVAWRFKTHLMTQTHMDLLHSCSVHVSANGVLQLGMPKTSTFFEDVHFEMTIMRVKVFFFECMWYMVLIWKHAFNFSIFPFMILIESWCHISFVCSCNLLCLYQRFFSSYFWLELYYFHLCSSFMFVFMFWCRNLLVTEHASALIYLDHLFCDFTLNKDEKKLSKLILWNEFRMLQNFQSKLPQHLLPSLFVAVFVDLYICLL